MSAWTSAFALPRAFLRRLVALPSVEIPIGQMVELPGRGTTYVTDSPGPPGAPTLLLLHAVGCTGLLTWFPSIPELTQHFRVITLDQRWHGDGIKSPNFSLYDCADDVAALVEVLELDQVIIAGYSMGSIVAQRVWRQHPDVVSGLVLCATTDRLRTNPSEMAFFEAMGVAIAILRALSRSRTARSAGRGAAQVLDIDNDEDLHDWALREFRRTSPWAVAQAVNALGRHHSTPWLPRIDVPTAVVITREDRVMAVDRQRALAERIPDSTTHEVDSGHAACVLEHELFVPVLLEACLTTAERASRRAGAAARG